MKNCKVQDAKCKLQGCKLQSARSKRWRERRSIVVVDSVASLPCCHATHTRVHPCCHAMHTRGHCCYAAHPHPFISALHLAAKNNTSPPRTTLSIPLFPPALVTAQPSPASHSFLEKPLFLSSFSSPSLPIYRSPLLSLVLLSFRAEFYTASSCTFTSLQSHRSSRALQITLQIHSTFQTGDFPLLIHYMVSSVDFWLTSD